MFFQPAGLFDTTNRFVTSSTREAPGFTYLLKLHRAVRRSIERRELNLIDLSDSLSEVKGPRYLDLTHYTPESNKAIAAAINAKLRD